MQVEPHIPIARIVTLRNGSALGQSFVVRYGRLHGKPLSQVIYSRRYSFLSADYYIYSHITSALEMDSFFARRASIAASFTTASKSAPGKTGSTLGDFLRINRRVHRFPGVDLENLFTRGSVRQGTVHLSNDRGESLPDQDFRLISSRHYDHLLVGFETVHFRQQ